MSYRLILAAACLCVTAPAVAQAVVPTASCELSKPDHYHCNRDGFVPLLARAKTIRVVTGRMDLYGNKQMQRLVSDLQKDLVTQQRADLVFELTWVDRSGRIDVGPSDVAIGRLNVYEPSRGSGDRSLVWVETFDSGEQTPWPAVTQALIQQFRQHIVEK